MTKAAVRLRETTPDDAPSLARIYADAVLNGVGTFEETPPDPAEMERRRAEVAHYGLPHLVAEGADGQVLGFAYASPFRTRWGYRWTAETTVYVDPEAHGRGVGGRLLAEVAARCEALGLRQLIGVIGGSENAASIAVHARCGFQPAGLLPHVGVKLGRWVDVVLMRRDLNGGGNDMPAAPGLPLPR